MRVRRSSLESCVGLAVLLGLGSACSGGQGESSDDGIGDAGSAGSTGSGDAEGGGTSTGGGGDATESSEDSTTGMGCGGELYSATSILPNMLIVQDRSGSMLDKIDGTSKWEIAKAAIEQVVNSHGEEVRFGLMLYPGTDPSCDEGMGCGPGHVFVDVGLNTGTEIIDALGASDTCNIGTPTAETLAPLHDYAGLEDIERPNYVVLITDGQSTCEDPVPWVASLRLEDPEIKTFVVGFGDGVDPVELEGMAQAGGTALPGDPNYYQADDAQALGEAFAAIAGNVLSCSYLLDQVPPDPDELYVYVDGVLIERDQTHADGWDYDPLTNQIDFFGPTCNQLQSGEIEGLEIIFGCPTVG